MEWMVPLADLDFGADEERAVLEVLRRRWLTMGAVTQAFEAAFADFVGARHAVALANCTQALHLACLALGIGPGDEVVLPALTFVASANAVLHTGADVRFADVLGAADLTISPQSIEACITARTKAILVVHYGGYPCRMPEIMALARRHDLAVIEDAAHAPGATLHGRALGTWGAAGCFSFFSNKNLATGEGGMLVTDRDDVAAKARLLRSHGMTSLTWDRHQGHAYTYDVVALGYNDRIDEVRSALGQVQLAKLSQNNARRRSAVARYRAALETPGFSALEVPFADADGQPAFHLMPILLAPELNRERVMETMRMSGVQTSIHYPPIHRFSYYRQRYPDVSLPITEALAAREVTLPLFPTMGDAGVDCVVDALAQALHAAPHAG
jgi:dTDP-4-amino-4,6-dideoxygalactose transaminase